MMLEYQRRPILINALHYFGGVEQLAFILSLDESFTYKERRDGSLIIYIPDLNEYLRPGDWLVKSQLTGRYEILTEKIFYLLYERKEK